MNLMPVEAVSIKSLEFSEQGRVAQTGPDFAQAIGQGLDQVDASLAQADAAARSMAAGNDIPVHDVMLAMEQAHLKLQFAVEVRNRVVEAYQSLTNMQV
ncbi:flagellar hook-basal body complex protein FliE [Dyella sp.]|uniref:flagellar hook-basal body complex protein FliE n=1 Tax=Dyella sp. TaxID=1869338 RepID=UPI002ED14D65